MSTGTGAKVGFIGLGHMGRAMAARLCEGGYGLFVADLDPGAIADFTTAFAAQVPDGLEALGRECDMVITMLPDGDVVREVVLGTEGNGAQGKGNVAAGLGPGSILIDMSSSAPMATRTLGARLADMGIAMIDAPVSGGVARAEDGTLSIMVGGDGDIIDRCRPLLGLMGQAILATGLLGSGHAMKALNNYVSAAGLLAATEALLIGQRFGLEAGVMVDVLNRSSGRNNSTENKINQFVLSRSFASGFSLGLMAKDLGTAADLARATESFAPFAEACSKLWTEAEAAIGGDVDHTALVQYFEQRTGEQLVCTKE